MKRSELEVGTLYGVLSGTGRYAEVRSVVRILDLACVKPVRSGEFYYRRDVPVKGISYVVVEQYDHHGALQPLSEEQKLEVRWVRDATLFIDVETARGRVRGVAALHAAKGRDKARIAKLKEYGVDVQANLYYGALSDSSQITMSLAQLRKLLPANAIPDPWNN